MVVVVGSLHLRKIFVETATLLCNLIKRIMESAGFLPAFFDPFDEYRIAHKHCEPRCSSGIEGGRRIYVIVKVAPGYKVEVPYRSPVELARLGIAYSLFVKVGAAVAVRVAVAREFLDPPVIDCCIEIEIFGVKWHIFVGIINTAVIDGILYLLRIRLNVIVVVCNIVFRALDIELHVVLCFE